MISFELICSYHSLAPMYYRGAKGAIVIYDITSRVSFITVVHCQVTFARAKDWVTELKQNCKNIGLNLSVANNPELVIALAGNKCDLVETVDYLRSLIDKQREVPKELAEEYAKEANIIFFEVSVGISIGIEDRRKPKRTLIQYSRRQLDIYQELMHLLQMFLLLPQSRLSHLQNKKDVASNMYMLNVSLNNYLSNKHSHNHSSFTSSPPSANIL